MEILHLYETVITLTPPTVIVTCKYFCFVWIKALHPNQQFLSNVGTEPPLPGYYQYFLGGKCILLKDTTRRPQGRILDFWIGGSNSERGGGSFS